MIGKVGGRSPGRVGVVTTVAALTVGTVGLVVWSVATAGPAETGGPATVPVGAAPVTRGSVTERVRIPGTYGFDGAYPVVHQGTPGIVTAIAAPGAVVERGGVLYAVDNRAVRLLVGELPAYRDFGPGMGDGPDVRQLEQNLVDLGLDPGRQIAVDVRFTAATGAAVKRWQAAWGLSLRERTGTLPLGQVVFLPVALRVVEATAGIGLAVGPNEPVLAASSTARVVTVEVGADRQSAVLVGDDVMVSLPSGAPMPGTVLRLGRVAVASGPDNGEGPAGPPTVTIVVGLAAPAGLPDLDQAPVLVAIASETHDDVLLVPVAALLARPGGGYQVRRAGGAARRGQTRALRRHHRPGGGFRGAAGRRPGRGAGLMTAVLELRDVRKVFAGDPPVESVRGVSLLRPQRRAGGRGRSVRFGQDHPAEPGRRSGPAHLGFGPPRRGSHRALARTVASAGCGRTGSAWSSSSTSCSSTSRHGTTWRPACSTAACPPASGGPPPTSAGPGRSGPSGPLPGRPALRRGAPARRHRPRARRPARARAGRRAHRQPGLGHRRRDPGPAAGAEPRGHHVVVITHDPRSPRPCGGGSSSATAGRARLGEPVVTRRPGCGWPTCCRWPRSACAPAQPGPRCRSSVSPSGSRRWWPCSASPGPARPTCWPASTGSAPTCSPWPTAAPWAARRSAAHHRAGCRSPGPTGCWRRRRPPNSST